MVDETQGGLGGGGKRGSFGEGLSVCMGGGRGGEERCFAFTDDTGR